MGDQWEARIGAIEKIQEEFGHDIREIKEQLVRLTSLFEDSSSSRPITIAKSIGPSTIHPNYEQFAT